MSNGTEITVTLPKAKEISITLSGGNATTITVGETFKDAGYIVTEDGVDVTSKSTMKKIIMDTSTGATVDAINTSQIGTYTITYTIVYGEVSKTLTRTVVVTPASNNSSTSMQ